MASGCVQDVLAVEVAETRPSRAAEESPGTDSPDGSRKRNLGRGTDRKRTATEARHPGLATDGSQVSRFVSAVRRHLEPALVNLCAESCEGHCCLRLLHFHH